MPPQLGAHLRLAEQILMLASMLTLVCHLFVFCLFLKFFPFCFFLNLPCLATEVDDKRSECPCNTWQKKADLAPEGTSRQNEFKLHLFSCIYEVIQFDHAISAIKGVTCPSFHSYFSVWMHFTLFCIQDIKYLVKRCFEAFDLGHTWALPKILGWRHTEGKKKKSSTSGCFLTFYTASLQAMKWVLKS